MVAKHGLIIEGGSWAEGGFSNLACKLVLLRCATAGGEDSQQHHCPHTCITLFLRYAHAPQVLTCFFLVNPGFSTNNHCNF
jgi:hypothetical protein